MTKFSSTQFLRGEYKIIYNNQMAIKWLSAAAAVSTRSDDGDRSMGDGATGYDDDDDDDG